MLLNSFSATDGECTRIGFSSLFFRKDFEFWNQDGSKIMDFCKLRKKNDGKNRQEERKNLANCSITSEDCPE
jgi:hypothetical protein